MKASSVLWCCRRRRRRRNSERSMVFSVDSILVFFSCTMATSVSFHAMQHSKLQTLEPAKWSQDNEDRSKPSRFRFIKYSKTLGNRMESLFATLLFELFNTYWIRCSLTPFLMLSCHDAKTSENGEKKIESKSWGFLVQYGFRLGMVAKVFAHFVQT